MTLKVMEFYSQPTTNSIYFEFDLSHKNVTDLIAFIKIIEVKFKGKIVNPHRFAVEPGKTFAAIQVSFPDSEALCDANNHCQINLTDAGRVKASYSGALDQMDRGRFHSSALLQMIINSNSSN